MFAPRYQSECRTRAITIALNRSPTGADLVRVSMVKCKRSLIYQWGDGGLKKFEDDVVISGIGQSAIGRSLGRSPLGLTVDAITAAVADAA